MALPPRDARQRAFTQRSFDACLMRLLMPMPLMMRCLMMLMPDVMPASTIFLRDALFFAARRHDVARCRMRAMRRARVLLYARC